MTAGVQPLLDAPWAANGDAWGVRVAAGLVDRGALEAAEVSDHAWWIGLVLDVEPRGS